jgi:hypothetical protein
MSLDPSSIANGLWPLQAKFACVMTRPLYPHRPFFSGVSLKWHKSLKKAKSAHFERFDTPDYVGVLA